MLSPNPISVFGTISTMAFLSRNFPFFNYPSLCLRLLLQVVAYCWQLATFCPTSHWAHRITIGNGGIAAQHLRWSMFNLISIWMFNTAFKTLRQTTIPFNPPLTDYKRAGNTLNLRPKSVYSSAVFIGVPKSILKIVFNPVVRYFSMEYF